MLRYLARQLATIIPDNPDDDSDRLCLDSYRTRRPRQYVQPRYGACAAAAAGATDPLWARPAAARAIRALPCQPGAGRSEVLICLAPSGQRADRRAAPATLLLTLSAIVAAFVGGVLLAAARNRVVDAGASALTVACAAMPPFLLGLLLILVFAVWLRWFPTSGYENARESFTGVRHALDVLRHLCLPWLALTLVQLPPVYRIARAGLAQLGQEPFITTMRAAGLPLSCGLLALHAAEYAAAGCGPVRCAPGLRCRGRGSDRGGVRLARDRAPDARCRWHSVIIPCSWASIWSSPPP